MTEKKTLSWAKHAVRRWKQVYFEILQAEQLKRPKHKAMLVFGNESPPETSQIDLISTKTKGEVKPSKTPLKKDAIQPIKLPTKSEKGSSKKKTGAARLDTKIKEINFLPLPMSFF